MNAKFVHPKGEMAERSTSAQGSHTVTAFTLPLGDRLEIRPIFDHSTFSVLCKGPLREALLYVEGECQYG